MTFIVTSYAVIVNNQPDYNRDQIVENHVLKELNMKELIYHDNLLRLKQLANSLTLTQTNVDYLSTVIKNLDRSDGKLYLKYFKKNFLRHKKFIRDKYLRLIQSVPQEEQQVLLQEHETLIERQAIIAYTKAFKPQLLKNEIKLFYNHLLYLILIGNLTFGIVLGGTRNSKNKAVKT